MPARPYGQVRRITQRCIDLVAVGGGDVVLDEQDIYAALQVLARPLLNLPAVAVERGGQSAVALVLHESKEMHARAINELSTAGV